MKTAFLLTVGLTVGVSSAWECADKHDECPQWAGLGECEKNQRYMAKHCAKSCKACTHKALLLTS